MTYTFLEHTLKLWKRKSEGMGVPIRNEHLYTLSFAKDQVVIAQDEDAFSYMIRKLEDAYKKNGLEININKTERVTIAQERIKNLEIEEGREIKETDQFKYLGFIISELQKKKLKTEWDKPEPLSYTLIRFYGIDT